MHGDGCVESLVDSIAASYPTSTMTFIMTQDIAEDVVRETRRAIVEPSIEIAPASIPTNFFGACSPPVIWVLDTVTPNSNYLKL